MSAKTSIAILKDFFGMKEPDRLEGYEASSKMQAFAAEVRRLREQDPPGYEWTVNEAAKALGVEVASS